MGILKDDSGHVRTADAVVALLADRYAVETGEQWPGPERVRIVAFFEELIREVEEADTEHGNRALDIGTHRGFHNGIKAAAECVERQATHLFIHAQRDDEARTLRSLANDIRSIQGPPTGHR